VPRLIDYMNRLVFGCWIPHEASIGAGVVLGYGGLSIVIHQDAMIGDRVHIDQGVTIGGNGTRFGVARVGDDVYIGAGAKILGPISIGHGAVIGANAVVLEDVPPRSVAVGVPARIVRRDIDTSTYLYHKRVGEQQ
jgi:serine O-acetyltransferase